MSMPSSSDEVATSAGRSPGFERVLDLDALRRARASRGARARAVSPASSLSARRQPLGEAPAVDEDQRRAVRADRAPAAADGWRPDRRRRAAAPRSAGGPSAVEPRHVLDRHLDRRSSAFAGRVDDRDGPPRGGRSPRTRVKLAPRPPRRRTASPPSRRRTPSRRRPRRRLRPGSARPRRAAAAWPRARCAAGGRAGAAPRSRSSDSARCAPRLVGTSAWISSTMTVSIDAQRLAGVRGQQQVERLGRRDQDVGRLAQEARAFARPACRRCGWRPPACERRRPRPPRDCGDAGERRAQVALDVDRQRLERRDVEDAAAPAGRRRRSNISRSMHQRNAASVLPLPVGARMSVESPPAMAGQPSACGGVGAANDARNHSATAGLKRASTSERRGTSLF